MVEATLTGEIGFVIGRLLYGGVLAFMGLNHFMQTDDMAEYADAMGVPQPRLAVLGSGAMLVLGGLGIVLGVAPVLAALLLAAFFVGVTPKMHPFWQVEDEEEKQQEMINFLKNAALLGGALVFLDLGAADWSYAVGVGLF